ncbi:hypothetical protein EV426DRAFT_698801 [Tirmania nivea]|nr:hypothetical protein EV426DRAFT_698801 [Tirmania nivea]
MGTTLGAAKLEVIRWIGGTASSCPSAIPDDAPESAQRQEGSDPAGENFTHPSGPKAWREARAVAKGKEKKVVHPRLPRGRQIAGAAGKVKGKGVGEVLPQMGPRAWKKAEAVAQGKGREVGVTAQVKTVGGKVAAREGEGKGEVVYGQKLCGELGIGAKRLELVGNGRKRMPEAGEVWVEVLNANRPLSGRDNHWKQQLVRNFNAFAEQKGIRVRAIRVEYDGRYPQERRIKLEPQEGFTFASTVENASAVL